MKRVIVRFHGGLDRYLGSRPRAEITVEDDASLLQVQDKVGIPRGEVGLFVVAGKPVAGDTVAEDGSIVDLFPTFGGG